MLLDVGINGVIVVWKIDGLICIWCIEVVDDGGCCCIFLVVEIMVFDELWYVFGVLLVEFEVEDGIVGCIGVVGYVDCSVVCCFNSWVCVKCGFVM